MTAVSDPARDDHLCEKPEWSLPDMTAASVEQLLTS